MLLSLQPSCPVCLRSIAVTNAMLIRQHCPDTSRCPGYRHPPAFLATAVLRPQCRQPLMTPGQEDRPTRSPDLALSPRTSEKTIKRQPKASRKCTGGSLPRFWAPLLTRTITPCGCVCSASVHAASDAPHGEDADSHLFQQLTDS